MFTDKEVKDVYDSYVRWAVQKSKAEFRMREQAKLAEYTGSQATAAKIMHKAMVLENRRNKREDA